MLIRRHSTSVYIGMRLVCQCTTLGASVLDADTRRQYKVWIRLESWTPVYKTRRRHSTSVYIGMRLVCQCGSRHQSTTLVHWHTAREASVLDADTRRQSTTRDSRHHYFDSSTLAYNPRRRLDAIVRLDTFACGPSVLQTCASRVCTNVGTSVPDSRCRHDSASVYIGMRLVCQCRPDSCTSLDTLSRDPRR